MFLGGFIVREGVVVDYYSDLVFAMYVDDIVLIDRVILYLLFTLSIYITFRLLY